LVEAFQKAGVDVVCIGGNVGNWGRKFRPFRKAGQTYGLNLKRMKSPGFIQLEAG
jgi:hypothetical protein